MIVRSTSNNIRENIFFLLYYFERDFRLSPKSVNFVTKMFLISFTATETERQEHGASGEDFERLYVTPHLHTCQDAN